MGYINTVCLLVFFGDTLSIGVANRQYREKCDIISLALHFGQGMAGRKDEI